MNQSERLEEKAMREGDSGEDLVGGSVLAVLCLARESIRSESSGKEPRTNVGSWQPRRDETHTSFLRPTFPAMRLEFLRHFGSFSTTHGDNKLACGRTPMTTEHISGQPMQSNGAHVRPPHLLLLQVRYLSVFNCEKKFEPLLLTDNSMDGHGEPNPLTAAVFEIA
jgi:hypothetical protein